jgi:CO dehydrogenase maturation factor
MKIAFVGKGGSGKTTMSTLFAQYASQQQMILAIDADINMHMAELFGVDSVPAEMLLSEKDPSNELRTWLRGTNSLIESNEHFKKSTPPANGSQLIDVTDDDSWITKRFGQSIHPLLSLMTVGSYSESGIASSCYHNNLAILENILSHTVDSGVVVVDMVAGTDAFASTLFAQFDALVFVAEPTKRSMAVFEQYKKLAEAGGVADRLYVIGNKIENSEDEHYIKTATKERIVGIMSRSKHLLAVDKGREELDVKMLDDDDQVVFEALYTYLQTCAVPMQERLPHLWRLHKTYANQAFVRDRFGDLTSQIDETFIYPKDGYEK